MARAKRHYIPGQVWHITHRCHKREFLFKFAKDRKRWLQWLFEAKSRYGLVILNYAVTSNHIHLLVVDDKDRGVIPNSIKLIAGRTGQEYNQRKCRKGAFWEDRYHATAIEDGNHLLQCLVYIDLNMVRVGVIKHPSEWSYCGYSEIQKPRRKNVLINYERLRELLGFDTYDRVKAGHKKWVESCLTNGENCRDEKWSRSIAVGSKIFIDNVKSLMGVSAQGRKSIEAGESYQLRETQIPYGDHFGAKKSEIEPENAYAWG
ncbi:MAG: transposase [Desulfobacteraceae bacterium]|nr:transposase [Desulfobacteraceae bacterium]MBC2757915.1 transposase [Desulfobacteraceae bacterium]